MLELFCFVIASIATGFLTAFGGIYGGIADIWKPILLLFGLTLAVLALVFVVLFFVSYIIYSEKPVEKPSKAALFVFDTVLAFIMRWSGAKIIVHGKEKVPDTNALWIMNHRSNFDPMTLSYIFKFKNMIMISKKGNFKIPILGGFIYKMGYMSINRENDREALKTILEAISRIKQGYSVTIYPEGTRNKTDSDLLPFKSGVFKIATKTNVPIVVTTIYGTQNIHKNFPFKRTKVYLDILDVIYPDDYKGKQTHELADITSEMMLNKVLEYKKTYNSKEKITKIQ